MSNKITTQTGYRLLQYNNLPLSFALLDEQDYSYLATTKGESYEYTNGIHGAYYPWYGEQETIEASNVDFTVKYDLKNLPITGSTNTLSQFLHWAKRNIYRSGKIWAVNAAGQLVYNRARLISQNDISARRTRSCLYLDISLELIDGVWTLANRYTTFLADFCLERFSDYDTEFCPVLPPGQCGVTGQSRCLACDPKIELPEKNLVEGFRPVCEFTQSQLVEMLSKYCPDNVYISEDPDLYKDRFCYDVKYGTKTALNSEFVNNETKWNFCLSTDLTSYEGKIVLIGTFTNPEVIVNGKSVKIYDTFENTAIVIDNNGDIYEAEIKDLTQRKRNLLSISTVTGGMPYFDFLPNANEIIVKGNATNIQSFAYVDPVEITA